MGSQHFDRDRAHHIAVRVRGSLFFQVQLWLQAPKQCPVEIAELASACMEQEAEARPSAQRIFEVITDSRLGSLACVQR